MNAILSKLTPFKNNRTTVVYNQSVGDIMTGILHTHAKYQHDYDKVCNQFDAPSLLNVCKNIFYYLKANTHYVVESDNKQTLRSPAAILMLGRNPKIGLDCKSYSLFIGGVLDALKRQGKKINWCYRFASYKFYDKLPHHVFVVVNPNTNNEIWVDPVLPAFNMKKMFNFKIDRKPMALIAVAGIGRTRRTKAEKKAKRKATKAKIKAKIKKVGKILVKLNPATASARNSFLLLVKLNAFGLAKKLVQVQIKNEHGLKSFWEKIGGSYTNLNKAINVGKSKGHKSKQEISGIGVLPALAAAIAAATPIVIKIMKLLKDAGIDTKDLEAAGKKVLNKVINKKVDDYAEAEADKQEEAEDINELEKNAGDEDSNNASTEIAPTEEESGDNGETIEGIFDNKAVQLGTAFLIGYGISKAV